MQQRSKNICFAAFTTHKHSAVHYIHEAIMCFGVRLLKRRFQRGVVHTVAGLCCDKPPQSKRPVLLLNAEFTAGFY